MFVLLCLLFVAQYVEAQCDVTLSATVTPVRCFGENNGSIDLTATGGTAPYNYLWSNGQTDEDLTDLAPGMYFVTVTDNVGCFANLARTVNEPSLLTASALGATIFCDNPIVGIPVTALGGIPPYQYFWSNGSTGIAFQTNIAGTYSVTVEDVMGCTVTAQSVVGVDTIRPIADAGPDLSLNCQTPEVTIGGNNSSAGANYLYNWSGPGITNGVGGNSLQQFPSVNKPGVYTLFVVNDFNGCAAEDEMQVGGQAPPVANAGPDTGLPCGGGQLTLDGNASTLGIQYTYQWITADGNFVSGTSTLNPVVDEPGTYRLILTDTNNGCTIFDDVKVFPGPVIPAQNHSILDVSCTGQLGIAAVNMTQGTGPYTYLWSNGGTDAAIINVGTGTYTVTVMDATGCNYYAELVVKDTSTLTINALTTSPDCVAGNNGAIDLVLTGIFGPFSYEWNTGETTQDLNNLSAGTYTVTVTYALGTCSEVLSINLPIGGSLDLSATITPSTCGFANGAIDLSILNGAPPFTVQWSSGAPSEDITNLSEGTYSVSVTDVNGCSAQLSGLNVQNDNSAPTLSAVVAPDQACINHPNGTGSIDLTVTPAGNYTYNWGNGFTTADLTLLYSGFYDVTVSAGGLCAIATATYDVPFFPEMPDTGPTFISGPHCGLTDGIINLSMQGGVSPFTFLWSNGATTQGVNNLPAGTYSVTITGANSCTTTLGPFSLTTQGALYFLSATTQGNTVCSGNPNGSIDLTITFPGNYTYVWSNGATTQDLTGLAPGTYSVTTTNDSGCIKTASYTVTNNPNLPVLTSTVTNTSCGGSDGSINLSVNGGTPNYTYIWVNGETNQDLSNLSFGIYTVTVTDALGCTQIEDWFVSHTSNATATLQVTDASCTGANPCNGFIDLTITSGPAPFEYFWSSGMTTQDHPNCCPGQYHVTISDANGCTKVFSATVGQSGSDVVTTTVPTDASCGLNNGSIDLTIAGGGSFYSYLWSNGVNTQDLSNLSPGTYTVTVTTWSSQCTQTTSATVVQAADMALSTFVVNDECGANGGLIDLTVSGGAGPFNYLWSNGSTFQINLNLTPGTYTVTVTDVGGCTKTTSATIIYISGLTLNLVATDATCNGNDGSIDLSVQGGIGPYSYLWMTGPTTQDVSGLVSGTYTVTVTSGANCTETASVQVGQSAGLVLNASVVPSNGCIQPNGAIDLTVTPPGVYTYQWSNGAASEDLDNLFAGSYTVTVDDGTGCTQQATYVVSDNPNAPVLSATPTASSCDLSNGMIDLTVTGGAGPFTHLWSNGVTTEDLFNITSGLYDVTVTGSNGCSNTTSILVDNLNPVISLSGIITANSACLSANGSIDLSVVPAGNYSFSWSTNQTTEDLFDLISGTYSVTVSAGGTCSAEETFNVGSNANVPILSTTVTDASCNGNDGAIDLTVSGGISPYTYIWQNGFVGEDPTGLAAGTYMVTVTDAVGCSNTTSANVGAVSSILATTVVTNVLCNGGINGAINLSVSGGTPGYSYLWSTNSTLQDLVGLVAGTYTVTITDNSGCTKTATATVNEPSAIVLSSIISPVSCNGGNNGSIDLTVNGGVPPYTYDWNPSSTNTQDLTNLVAGVYCVTVTDVNNCTTTSCEIVSEPALLTFDIISLTNDCISETITGPNLPGFSYQWTGPNNFNSTTAAISVSISGLYSLTITNPSGCTASKDYTVNLIGSGACGVLKGRVGHDEDEDCVLSAGEPGLAGWIVRAEGANDTLYGVTDAQGQYFVGVPIGTYTMQVFVPNGLWTICPGGSAVSLNSLGDTIAGGDFPVKTAFVCPALSVSMGANKLRRCFPGNFYHVEYCNLGTAAAQDAYVTVALDPFLTPLSSSVPYTDLGSNVLQFDLGTLDIGECGDFSIEVFVNCNAVLGQTHCSQATIFPDSLCLPPNANWSGASLQVSSICNPDSLRFVIKNVGTGTMNNTSGYIVVEDGVMFRQGTLAPLEVNETMDIVVPANGSTWRVEVGQEAFHPYPAPVGLSVEGCATSSSFSTGFVNQFSTQDEPSSTDIDCMANTGSFDPNDKHSYPVGYGADHYIRPGTDIEYLIRFQNTGTDTAFTVEIVDTLSAWLDPTTIRFGASSHPYQYDLNGQGVVHFLFEDILLPDSSTNEVASLGFAKFSIKPRLDAPLLTRIENTAAIYFDFNDPIFTNTTWHRLGENFITVGLWQPEQARAKVVATPNPFNEQTILEVTGLSHSAGLRLEVFDLQGRVVRTMESENALFLLKKGDWPSGIYLFKITQNGRLVGNGKLMAE